MSRKTPKSKYIVRFFIRGEKTQEVGYRTHLAMLALTSGVERLYAETLSKKGGGALEQIGVYAGADTRRNLNKFYQNVRTKIPVQARHVKITPMKDYHSLIIVPTVIEYVSTLTASELGKGISTIEALGKETKEGFAALAKELNELPPKIGDSVVGALRKAGYFKPQKKPS